MDNKIDLNALLRALQAHSDAEIAKKKSKSKSKSRASSAATAPQDKREAIRAAFQGKGPMAAEIELKISKNNHFQFIVSGGNRRGHVLFLREILALVREIDRVKAFLIENAEKLYSIELDS